MESCFSHMTSQVCIGYHPSMLHLLAQVLWHLKISFVGVNCNTDAINLLYYNYCLTEMDVLLNSARKLAFFLFWAGIEFFALVFVFLF